MSRTTVGVVTIVAGRRAHLRRQLEGLARQHRPADRMVIVRMDREPIDVPAVLRDSAPAGARDVTVLDVPVVGGRLPLAAARNAGVQALDTDVVVLLDVDCIPGAGLVAGYADAAERVRADGSDGLLCGILRYLSPGLPAGGLPSGGLPSGGASGRDDPNRDASQRNAPTHDVPTHDVPADGWDEAELVAGSRVHPARPLPGRGELIRLDRHELAWTTSLALRTETFRSLNGFDERFTGYGGEDTDFGVRAAQAGLGVWWSGDAVAYHQHHESQTPPRQHLADIVRNAQLFAELHGWYPMQGWLTTFEQEGLVEFDPTAGRLELAAP